jgi:transcriptional regulator with XRE-family HTH domain
MQSRLGQFLGDFRQASKLTLREIASVLEFSAVHCGDIERGRRNFPYRKLPVLAKYCGVKLSFLIALYAIDRGILPLPVRADVFPCIVELASKWDSLTEEQFEDILEVIE